MGKRSGLLALVVVAGLPLHTASIADGQTLRVDRTCQSAGSIVAVEVQKAASTDRGVLASLIRLHFHHCFVNSSDGQAEKNDKPNLSLRGFDVIDRIKARLEAVCAQTVSSADIVAFAARDSVNMVRHGYCFRCYATATN
nr:unnamed protein product [Digitaria exilis]